MKYLFSNTELTNKKVKNFPFEMSSMDFGSFKLYTDVPKEIYENHSAVGLTEGYFRDLTLKESSVKIHMFSAFEKLQAGWPLPQSITGSFSTILINKRSNDIILCNDLIGLYPIYYYIYQDKIYVSNSIILMSAITAGDLDEVGILQRSIGQDFSNIGSRTILKDCKRLLPGEYIKLDATGNKIEKLYDNSLFQNISSSSQDHTLHPSYWSAYKKEVELLLLNNKKVKIALSGGIDSRVVLGAVPAEKDIECLTFGAKDNYETRIASRLASLKKAKFKNFYEPDLYFPPYQILKKYTLETEAVQICSWLEILENVTSQSETPILLGELCEALPARNIRQYSSRKFRQANFYKYYLLKKDYEFERATPEKFAIWKEGITQHYMFWYADVRLKRMKSEILQQDLKAAVINDLQELFTRIEAHNLPYVELYDELFSWYTYTRMRLAKQLQISNSRYKAYSPAMSIQVLRNTSNLHPNLRLNYRFVKKMFRDIQELREFNKIPTSQAPLVPQYFPDFIKFPVWGIRSKIDEFLVKRMMKIKNPNSRYRLFKSIDWARVYQNPEMERNFKAYFKNNHLGTDYYENLLDQCIKRKNLDHWPFANIDIINAAGLNIELDIIKSLRKG